MERVITLAANDSMTVEMFSQSYPSNAVQRLATFQIWKVRKKVWLKQKLSVVAHTTVLCAELEKLGKFLPIQLILKITMASCGFILCFHHTLWVICACDQVGSMHQQTNEL